MKILKPLINEFQGLLENSNINEEIDIKISSIESFDYQINNLVKHQNHKDIEKILNDVEQLALDIEIIDSFEITEKNFFNFTINLNNVQNYLENFKENIKTEDSKKIIIDYGGPNIGKPLHVGHLRSLNIGRSLYETNKLIGNIVTSDIHLGDWGMPVAQIIAYCELENININSITVQKLIDIYPKSTELYKEDESFQILAKEINKNLNKNEKESIEKWKNIRNVSVSELKETLSILNHDFDLWLGESDVNNIIKPMIEKLTKEKKITLDDGALVSTQEKDPKILITKSDGSYLYLTTDLGTVLNRLENYQHDIVLYVVDNRQKLHFEQLFESIKYFDFPEKEYEHVGFGTVNDEKGNPFKTREGGVKQLIDLYKDTCTYLKNINKDLGEEIIHELANTVLTYSDLLTNRKTDYKFNLNKFTSISGKTGVYVQYAQVRAKRLLEKSQIVDTNGELMIANEEERSLIVALLNLEFYINQSTKFNEPHHLANYLYDISNLFNNFYQGENILSVENEEVKKSKLLITKYFLQNSNLVMSCLGINPVNKM
jgi:arginyl-tRNA synthetase